jgi:hypothetical protein
MMQGNNGKNCKVSLRTRDDQQALIGLKRRKSKLTAADVLATLIGLEKKAKISQCRGRKKELRSAAPGLFWRPLRDLIVG